MEEVGNQGRVENSAAPGGVTNTTAGAAAGTTAGIEIRVPAQMPAQAPMQASAQAPSQEPVRTGTGNKANLIADYIFWIMAAVVLLRFAFKLIGANSHNTFVTLIYNVTAPVANIFGGIVSDVVSGPMVIEFSSLIAVAILWLLYKGALRLITIVK